MPTIELMGDDRYCSPERYLDMTPKQKAELENHLNAIAQILYQDSDPAGMQTLEGIELTVREQIQRHVSPELGRFLSERLPKPNPASQEGSKVPSEN